MRALSEDAVVLVTGASQGIGRSIAEAFFEADYRVAFNGRSTGSLNAAIAGKQDDRVCALPGDVTKPEVAKSLVAQTLERFGRLDVLVCNVGSGSSVPPGQEHHEEWLRMLSLNLLSTTNMVEAARDALSAVQGNVVCISSICGQEVIPGAPVTYGVAKAALNAYIRGSARPLGRQGIRINAIAPGNVLFPGSVWEKKLAADPASVEEMLRKEVALGRLGRPAEIARLALWLASPAAEFTTGSIMVMDGGQVRS